MSVGLFLVWFGFDDVECIPVPGVGVGMGHPVYDISQDPRPKISHKCILFADEGKSEDNLLLLL